MWRADCCQMGSAVATDQSADLLGKLAPSRSDSAILDLIQASDDFASFLRYPLVRCLMRGGWKRCDGFG